MTGKQIEYLELAEAYDATARDTGTFCCLGTDLRELAIALVKAEAATYRRLAYPVKPGLEIKDYTQEELQ